MNVRKNNGWFAIAASIALGAYGCGGSGSPTVTSNAPGKFTQVNLVSDQPGVAAVTDASLVNPWGISASTTSPFWISDNGTGLSTLYTGSGTKQALVVTIPPAAGAGNGPVTGQLFNSTTDFMLPGAVASRFLFASEDGVITGWGGGAAAVVVADRSAQGAIYKGLAMASNGGANFLYAANFHSGKVDVFNATFGFVQSFTDPSIPNGFGPFNVVNIGGLVYVAYAKQDATQEDEVAGAGLGYITAFNPDGTVNHKVARNAALNAPWGMVIAPAGFGNVGGKLLVGNFGDGRINVYDPATGQFFGPMKDAAGAPLFIDGLWGLIFGNGANGGDVDKLYFTAGPNNETHGLLGSLQPVVTP